MKNVVRRRLPKVLREPGFWLVGAVTLPGVLYSAAGVNFLMREFAEFCLGLLALTGGLWVFLARPPWFLSSAAQRRAFRLRRAGSVALWAAFLASVPITRWPARLTFLTAEPTLNRIADQIQRGETPRLPARAGLLVIREARMWDFSGAGLLPSLPCLWIQDHGLGLSGAGFVRGSADGAFNAYVVSRLQGNWSQFDED